MTRRNLATALAVAAAVAASAQNVQLHYDPRHSLHGVGARDYLTSTVEMFKPDAAGSTFFFIDMDYNGDQGIGGAYWEIARDVRFWQPPVAVHVEYNGGLAAGYSFGDAWLLGAAYSCDDAQFTKGISFSINYKYIRKTWDNQPHNFQLTAAWYLHFARRLLSFTGFADLWRERTAYAGMIFLAEPQLWLNLNGIKGVPRECKLSAGTEVKCCYNFGGMDGFYVIPTVAVKWTFGE